MPRDDILKNRIEELFSSDILHETQEYQHKFLPDQTEKDLKTDSGIEVQLQKKLQELNCLNEIGHLIDEKPSVSDFFEWLSNQIPSVVQFPGIAVAAVTHNNQVFGNPSAVTLPSKIVAGIRIGADLLGYIHIAYTEKRIFLDEESAFIGAVAGRVSSYLENQKLLTELERRANDLSILNELGQVLSTNLSSEKIARIIFEYTSKLMEVADFFVAYYDSNSETIAFPFLYINGEELGSFSRHLGNGLTDYVIRKGEALLLSSNVTNHMEEIGLDIITVGNTTPAQSWLGVPIIFENNVLGVISLQTSEKPGLYSVKDKELLTAISRQSAVAINNSFMVSKLNQSNDDLIKFKQGIDQTSDAVFITDRNGFFTYANPAFENVYGFNHDELIGQTPRILKSGTVPKEKYEDFWNTLLTGEIFKGEVINKSKDGRLIPIEGANVPILDDQQEIVGFLAIHRDITKRKESDMQIEKRASDLETIAQLSVKISSILDSKLLLQFVVDQAKKRFDLNQVLLYLIDYDNNQLSLAAAASDVEPNLYVENQTLKIRHNASIIARSARELTSIIANKIENDEKVLSNSILPETRSEAVIPLISGNKILGVLDLQSKEKDHFTPELINIFTTLTSQIAVGLKNANMYEETQTALSQTSALLSISQATIASLEIDEILSNALESVIVSTGYECGLISIFNPTSKKLELIAKHNLPEEVTRDFEIHGFTGSLIETVFDQKKRIVIDDLNNTNLPIQADYLHQQDWQSFYGMPMEFRGKYLGTICLLSTKPGHRKSWIDSLLQAASRQISIAIENVSLFKETQSALEQADLLYKGSDRVIQSTDSQMLLDAIIEFSPAKKYEYANLLLFDKPWKYSPPEFMSVEAVCAQDRNNIFSTTPKVFKSSEFPFLELAESDQPIVIANVIGDHRFGSIFDVQKYKSEIKSLAMFPVKVSSEFIGLIILHSKEEKILEESSIRQIESLVDQAATVLQSIKLNMNLQLQLSEMENLQRLLSREAWSSYRSQDKTRHWGYEYNFVETKPIINSLSGNGNSINDSFVKAPLEVRGEVIGGLAIQAEENSFLTEEERDFLEAVADQVSQALERSRLIEQTQKSAVELQTVAQVSSASSTLLEPLELLQSVVDLAKNSFGLYHAHIYLLDETESKLVLSSGSGTVGRKMVEEGWEIYLDEDSIVTRSARILCGQIENDVKNTPDFLPNPLLPNTVSEMAVPMIAGKKLLGIFDLQSDLPNHFSEEDQQTFTTLASQTAIALQNARLFEEQSITLDRLRELDLLKTSFLANMSHELRTPLNSILGFTQVILEGIDGPLTDYMVSDLQLIEKNGKHLLYLINEVLDMAKIESGRMSLTIEPIYLRELLEDVLETTSAQARERAISLTLDSSINEELTINADQIRLRQIMLNLVGNSIKFTETGGVTVKVLQSPKEISIYVEDTGIGIPPNKLETIFEAFSQVDTSTTRKAGGTGLGLPISRKLVELHGGKLWAESEGLGKGTTMHLVLPINAKME